MRFSKKVTTALMVLIIALMPLAAFASNDVITVTIDGVAVEFTDQQPVIIDGRTLVPAGGVFQALGFNPSWNSAAQTATLTRDDFTIVITIGNAVFTTNGIQHTLDVPAQIINGRTMLPIRAVLESVGYQLNWNSATRTVVITTEVVAEAAVSVDELVADTFARTRAVEHIIAAIIQANFDINEENVHKHFQDGELVEIVTFLNLHGEANRPDLQGQIHYASTGRPEGFSQTGDVFIINHIPTGTLEFGIDVGRHASGNRGIFYFSPENNVILTEWTLVQHNNVMNDIATHIPLMREILGMDFDISNETNMILHGTTATPWVSVNLHGQFDFNRIVPFDHALNHIAPGHGDCILPFASIAPGTGLGSISGGHFMAIDSQIGDVFITTSLTGTSVWIRYGYTRHGSALFRGFPLTQHPAPMHLMQ